MSKVVCSVCTKAVKNNQNAIFCDVCLTWSHLNCTHLSKADYSVLSNCSDSWFCPPCLSKMFPFNSIQDHVDFLPSLYNFTKCNTLNVNLIKNAQQLHLTANIKPCNSKIDADKFFTISFQMLGVHII